MIPAILGRKMGMTRIYREDGQVVPVTVVQAGPCVVLQVKSRQTDGYDAVQIGFEEAKPARSTRARIGHCLKAGAKPQRHAREIRLAEAAQVEPGAPIKVDMFAEAGVKYVDVVGTSKGFGFQGVMKRHRFGGQPASHGTERKHRSPGAIGAMAGDRGRGRSVKKGKKMAGRMGGARSTVRCLELMSVDANRNVMVIKGALPGPNGSVVFIRKSKTRS